MNGIRSAGSYRKYSAHADAVLLWEAVITHHHDDGISVPLVFFNSNHLSIASVDGKRRTATRRLSSTKSLI